MGSPGPTFRCPQTGVFEQVVTRRYRVAAEICGGLDSGLLPTMRPTRKSGCAPSAHPLESLPLASVVRSPILEYHAGPGAFVALLRSATNSRPMTHALHMLHKGNDRRALGHDIHHRYSARRGANGIGDGHDRHDHADQREDIQSAADDRCRYGWFSARRAGRIASLERCIRVFQRTARSRRKHQEVFLGVLLLQASGKCEPHHSSDPD